MAGRVKHTQTCKAIEQRQINQANAKKFSCNVEQRPLQYLHKFMCVIISGFCAYWMWRDFIDVEGSTCQPQTSTGLAWRAHQLR